jgi:hypothetical protein
LRSASEQAGRAGAFTVWLALGMLGILRRAGRQRPKNACRPVALSQPAFVIGQLQAALAGV